MSPNEVRLLAAGLADLGFRRGDRLIVVGDNRPKLYWSMCAAQSLGGVPVPVYRDSVADELAYVVDHAGARFALAENQEQVDKLLEIQKQVPSLETIIYVDRRGLRHYTDLLSYADLQARGARRLAAAPDAVSSEVAKGNRLRRRHHALHLRHHRPAQGRGAELRQPGLGGEGRRRIRRADRPATSCSAYLPMAWVGDHIFSYAQGYVVGLVVNCPESAATVMTDLREIGPTYYFAPPRVLENLITQVTIRMEDAGVVKRRMFQYLHGGRATGRTGAARRPAMPSLWATGCSMRWADLLIYGPLKNTLGMSRVRVASTAGEAVGPEIFNFYRALGVNMKQLYGQTEASVFVTIHPNGEVYPDTVGKPVSRVELRIAESRARCSYPQPRRVQGYFKNPQATNDTKTDGRLGAHRRRRLSRRARASAHHRPRQRRRPS